MSTATKAVTTRHEIIQHHSRLANARDNHPTRYRRPKTYRERMWTAQNDAMQRRAARRKAGAFD